MYEDFLSYELYCYPRYQYTYHHDGCIAVHVIGVDATILLAYKVFHSRVFSAEGVAARVRGR